jgi:DNA replication protein DnaC
MKRVGEMLPPTGSESSKKTNAANNGAPAAHECDICGGLGWISADVPVGHPLFGKLVPCPHRQAASTQAVSQKLWDALGPLRDMTIDNFQPEGHAVTVEQRTSLRTAHEGVKRFIAEPRGWLFVQGSYGCGKTHLAAAIANACLGRGTPVLFVNVPDLLDYLRSAYSPTVEETYNERFNEVRDAPVLILDDLGTQNATPWAEEKLYQILNARYINKRPTVITTNLELDELDPRLRSRLADLDLVRKLPILAPDFRRSAVEQGQSSMSSLALYHDKTFATFDSRVGLTREEQANLKEALRLAKGYAKQPQDWLMFIGGYGTGKTHLAAAIANYQAERGYPAMFVVVPDLLDHLRATFSPEARTSFDQRFEEVRTTQLLVLDDLGTESATSWAREKLYQIINHRYVARLPTVITASVSPDDLDPRIRTRILDETRCMVFPITVVSYRGGQAPKPARSTKSSSSRRKG